ncbi:beta-ketoacyl synthase chain length factor [bacterium]|nr:beta-ketoacyl synthase chain length factor [bacterium]
MSEVFISKPVMWAPGLEADPEKWEKWLLGAAEIEKSKTAPKLEYTDPMFRRRLSQISKMTVHVIHDFSEKYGLNKETKVIFVSLRGEIAREFSINQGIIEEKTILPAGFSLSVFNTPVALAAIAFGLTGGYSAIYPSKGDFSSALKTALAAVKSGSEKEVLLVYADELVPECYVVDSTPLSFAALLSCEKTENNVELDDIIEEKSPVDFLKALLKRWKSNV